MDTFTGTNNAALDTNKWSVTSVTSLAYIWNNHLGLSIANGNSNDFVRVDSIMPQVTTQDCYFEIYRTGLTGVGLYGAMLGWSGTAGRTGTATNGWKFAIGNTSTSLTLQRFENNVATNFSGITVPAATDLGVRFRYEGGQAKFRIWSLAGAEPSTWALDTTQTALPAGINSLFGYGLTSTTTTLYVDFDSYQVDDLASYSGWGMSI